LLHLFILYFKKILKGFTKFFLIFLLSLIFIEFISRLIVFIPTNINVFKYGFKKTISFDMVDLSKFQISIYDFDKKIKAPVLKESSNKFWIFGGSTTYGNNCEFGQSSSWPIQLYQISNKFEFKNFAFNGATTDQQLILLLKEITTSTPKSILWASKFNTLNVTTSTNYRNKDILNYDFQKSKKNELLINIKKVDKTLKSFSIFYSLFDQIIYRISRHLGLRNQKIQPKKEDIFFALKNFEINTIKAIEASLKYDVKEFFIISLFFDYDHKNYDDFQKYRFTLYKETIKNIAKSYTPFVKIIDLDEKFRDFDKKELLCDMAHQTLKGNVIQSDFIFKELSKNSEVINE